MPRHPPTLPTDYAARETLVADLAKEIKEPGRIGQPIIIEKAGTGTQSVLTHVIWDRWEDCPRELRADIILDAYEKALGPEYRGKISLAIGIVVPEAAAMGLLPYEIRPRLKPQGPTQEQYDQAMVDAGASTLSASRRPILRCATEEDADATYQRLHEILPDSWWIVAVTEEPDHAGD
jgi:hypothetical protein